MNKIIGICNLHDDPHLGQLTAKRPCGAVSFLGRYGLIDFTLSNFSNSEIDRIYVLVKNGILAMKNHIGSGSIWNRNTRRGFVNLLINEEGLFNPKFNTDLANIKANLSFDDVDFDYAVIAPSFMLGCIDYRPIVDAHIESEADVTVVYTHVLEPSEDFINCDRLKFGADNKIIKIDTNLGRTKEADISLESFVVSKKILKKIVNDVSKVSEMFTLRQMIKYYVGEEALDVRGYKYDGFIIPILSMESYVEHSLDLLNYHVRSKFFKEDWPIYTTTHNTPPALYGRSADVKNSFIANGSIIKGKVENSIISRDVLVERGAVVKNCILFTRSEIGKDVKISNVLCDKSAKVYQVKELEGKDGEVLYIKQGAKI